MPNLSLCSIEPGHLIVDYRVVRVLGSGGTGVVCLTDPQAALKIASPYIAESPDFREQFVRAADLASRLDHVNLIPVLEHGESRDGLLWLAMPYVDGPNADSELRAGRMAPTRAARIVEQIASAVDYVHRKGVLHGDIKPTNFLLSRGDWDGERAQLADFGDARKLRDARIAGRTGTVLLSAAYAAPEVLLGQPADGRADIYSLGCALFRLLTGKPPFFAARSKSETIAAHLHRTPPPVTSLAPWLPAAIDEVIANAMAKNPSSRFATARSFALATRFALNY